MEMRTYTFEPTEIEAACGVTAEDVARELPRCFLPVGTVNVAVPAGLSPALSGAVARTALGGPVEFLGIHKHTGFPVYCKEG
jgi:hypothetical protein